MKRIAMCWRPACYNRGCTLMADLYSDDITNDKAYPAATILQDIRSLIASGQREGPLLD